MSLTNATPRSISFLWLAALVILWLLISCILPTQAMDSIPFPFFIEIDGKPVARVDNGAGDRTQARLGKDAAVFSLQNGRLQCGEWIMGRDVTENRSYGPKKVSWYKAGAKIEEQVQPISAKKEGDAYQLIFTKGMLMADEDGMVLVDLLGEAHSKARVILQEE